MEIEKKIIWLASYPKSGNTWFRAFLSALLGETDLNIDDLKTDGIFCDRGVFDLYTDLDSTELYDSEIKNLLPEVYTAITSCYEKKHLFIKIHDAYTHNTNGQPIVPASSSNCAIYFIRNPLDLAASFANHNGGTIDEAIQLMNNPDGCLARQSENNNLNFQLRQLMLSWSMHVESWANQTAIPVLFVRYEDMLADTQNVFKKIIAFMGVETTPQKIDQAIAASSFENLKKHEQEKGFYEKSPNSLSFFRKGKAGNWPDELTKEQAASLIDEHKITMAKFGYLPKENQLIELKLLLP